MKSFYGRKMIHYPKFFKKAALFFAALFLFTSVFAVLPAFAATDAPEIAVSNGVATNVVWNYGYVGPLTTLSAMPTKLPPTAMGKRVLIATPTF